MDSWSLFIFALLLVLFLDNRSDIAHFRFCVLYDPESCSICFWLGKVYPCAYKNVLLSNLMRSKGMYGDATVWNNVNWTVNASKSDYKPNFFRFQYNSLNPFYVTWKNLSNFLSKAGHIPSMLTFHHLSRYIFLWNYF